MWHVEREIEKNWLLEKIIEHNTRAIFYNEGWLFFKNDETKFYHRYVQRESDNRWIEVSGYCQLPALDSFVLVWSRITKKFKTSWRTRLGTVKVNLI